MAEHDVVVIGAGPSGMAAAAQARAGGLRVALVDQQPRIGGAYWRHRPRDADAAESEAHHDWTTFRRISERSSPSTAGSSSAPRTERSRARRCASRRRRWSWPPVRTSA